MIRDCQCLRVRHAHGTKRAYLADGCRCDPCRAANAASAREWRKVTAERHWAGDTAWTDATGSRRRLQALAAAGWSGVELASHLGVTYSAVHWLRVRLDHRCLKSTADRVQAVYDELWHQTPTGVAVERTRMWAAKFGYPEPWQWDGVDIDDPFAEPVTLDDGLDEIAIDEAIAGRDVRLSKAEKTEAIARMRAMGMTADQAAARLGVASRTIERHTAKNRRNEAA